MASTTPHYSPGPSAEMLRPSSAPPNSESSGGLDAAHANLDGYLNEPVRDIMSRLGLAPNAAPGNPANSAQSANPAPSQQVQQPQSSSGDSPGGGGGGFDPSQMIQPVTDALGSLGSGQMGQPDPTQSFDGIGQALDSAGSQVQQALSGLGDDWQGDAGTAAQATTQAALQDGSKVADQAATLRSSLATATVAVQDAQARLIEIINVFWAKIAAIGPSIIFPWGIAAAIAAATEAVTSTSEVMAETQGALAAQAAAVTTAGAPVDVTAIPGLGTGAQALNPLLQLASSATSPVMQAIGSASSAASGTSDTPADAPSTPVTGSGAAGSGGSGTGAAGGAGALRGGLSATATVPAARSLGAAAPVTAPETTTPAQATSARSGGTAGGAGAGAPMGGGAPMGHQGKAGIGGDHSAADFLHTSDQGGEIVGDLGSVAPPVIGEKDPLDSPDVGLRIS